MEKRGASPFSLFLGYRPSRATIFEQASPSVSAMSYAVQKDSSRRLAGLAVVVVFHGVLIYALVHGLARQIVEVISQPLETKIIEEVKAPPPDKPPPPPPPKLAMPPPPYIPPPEVQVQVSVSAPTITAVTSVKPPEEYRTPAVVDAKSCSEPPYPAAARRANETGTVRLTFLIDVDGRVLDSKVERTSGSRRLDEAARAGLSLCKFKPATVNGRPVRTWDRLDYVWKLE
jgi:protein TonB